SLSNTAPSPTQIYPLSLHDALPISEEFEKRIAWLQPYHRPIICTEYMARGNGSTFQGSLPIARKYQVAAINWGLVAGKTQTYLPDRKSTRLNSSHVAISYAVSCLKK